MLLYSPYAWVPSSSLLANPSMSTSTNTDGTDTATSSASKSSSGLASSTSVAALPSQWPSKIVPQTDNNTDTTTTTSGGQSSAMQTGQRESPPDSTLISILLTTALSWSWLLSNADASAQVFAYMPVLLADVLHINQSAVTTDSLEAMQPPAWNGDGKEMYVRWDS